MIIEARLPRRRDGRVSRAARGDEPALTRVAVLATPVRLDVLAKVLEDEPGAALRALTVVDHRAKLGAVLNAALLVVGEVGAEIDRRQPRLQALPTPAAVFADQAVT